MAPSEKKTTNSNIRYLETRLENMATTKASKEFVNSELARLREKLESVRGKVDEVEERASQPHICNQSNMFDALSARLSSNKSDIDSNASSIKKLYTWQSGVGISLLLFFLTIGVAAFQYVQTINFAVEKNVDNINRISPRSSF